MKKSSLRVWFAQLSWRDKSISVGQLRRSQKSGRLTPLRTRFVVVGGSVAGTALSALGLLGFQNPFPLHGGGGADVQKTPTRYCGSLDDHRPITLTDGTEVELHAGACISIDFSTQKRTVRLDSEEAIFTVVHDPRRPFVVQTGPIVIEDVGTRFSVYRRQTDTRVLVLEGAVQIPSLGTNLEPVTALQQIVIPDDISQPRKRRAITHHDFDRMTAWLHGDIELERQTVQEAIDEFARYEHIRAEFRDPRIAEIPFGGTFPVTEVRSFLVLLAMKCIHSDLDAATQRVTFTRERGCKNDSH